MRDDIPTTDAEGFLAVFEVRAAEEHAKRMSEIRRRMDELLAHEWSRDLVPAMVAMEPMHRHRLFGRVMRNHDGARSIDGLESLLGFVAGYVMDDSECHPSVVYQFETTASTMHQPTRRTGV